MGSLRCVVKHLDFMGLVICYLGKELIRPRWNGIKTLVLAKTTFYMTGAACKMCLHSAVMIPILLVGAISALTVQIEVLRYSIRIMRMYELYFVLEQL